LAFRRLRLDRGVQRRLRDRTVRRWKRAPNDRREAPRPSRSRFRRRRHGR
jgi:hypothetical protein